MTPSTSSGQRQPVRFAQLRGGQHLHKLKWHPGAIFAGGWEARCGLRAWRDEYWEFNPPEGVKPCAYCNGKGDERSKEWDQW